MRGWIIGLVAATLSLACSTGCRMAGAETTVPAATAERVVVRPEARPHEDGTYRGIFADKDAIQVNVQFTLRDGIVEEFSLRHLARDENYRLENPNEPYRSVVAQYQEAARHLVGKALEEHLADLYEPGEIVTTEIDGYSGATIRSNKIISAVRDGLNRGVYSY